MNNELIVCNYDPESVREHGLYPSELMQADFEYINKDIADINKSFVRLGFHLNELLYYYKKGETCGYNDFYDLCLKNFGLEKTQVSRLISICRRFCTPDNSFNPSMFLNDKYKLFSYSQLVEMLPMKEDMINKIKPEMSIREIREVKKDLKNKGKTNNNLSEKCDVATNDENLEHNNSLCPNDFLKYKGVVLKNKIKNAKTIRKLDLIIYDNDGNYVDHIQGDILISGELGYNEIKLTIRENNKITNSIDKKEK